MKNTIKLIFFFYISVVFKVCLAQYEPASDINALKTFGTMGKELKILSKDAEHELFTHKGKGVITHMWFGGSFKGYEETMIRIYVDGEELASISFELFLGHGIGFNDRHAPWGTERMGKTGDPSGVYNTYKIPFGTEIKITGQLAPEADEDKYFWWIIRGTENLPIEISGVRLPENARLKLHKLEDYEAEPLEEFDLCDLDGGGMLYMVAMEAKGLRDTDHWKDLSYMESCMRAYFGGAPEPVFLSSGLEDYFLGTYYFNKGRYENMLGGLTHLDKDKNEFSGYRLHEDDPVFFQGGIRLTNRCGEKIGDKVFHDPPKTMYTTYTWVYQW